MPLRAGHIGLNQAPQLSLPSLLRGQGFRYSVGISEPVPTVGPVLQPVCPVNLILVVQLRQAAGQLVPFDGFRIIG